MLNGPFDGAFVAGPIEHAELDAATVAFREELVLVTARRWASLAALRAGTPESGPTALVVPHRLHLPAAARADLLGIRLAVFRAVRTRHARRHDRLRCRRHGRDAMPRAVVGRNDTREHSHAEPGAVQGRDALHHPPHAHIDTARCRALRPA